MFIYKLEEFIFLFICLFSNLMMFFDNIVFFLCWFKLFYNYSINDNEKVNRSMKIFKNL